MSVKIAASKMASVLFATLTMAASCGARSAVAQAQPAPETLVSSTSSEAPSSTSLPEAPSALYGDQDDQRRGALTINALRLLQAPKYAQVIEPEYNPVPLNGRDKVLYAGHEIFSLQFPVGVLVSAGLSQGLDTDPKYGDDATAFAQKVGAAGARGASQIIFSDGILAPVLREDPRYYVLGPQHSFSGRLVYAATRVFITRNDHGNNTINFATLGGYGGSAALTQLYYPAHSRDAGTMLNAYGGSLVGLAIENEFQEFFRFFVRNQPKR